MASKTFYSNTYGPRTLRLELTQYQDIPNNKSRIHWKFISAGSNSSASLFLVYATTIKINGQQVYYKGDTQWYGTGTPENPHSTFPAAEGSTEGDVWVTHNTDGSLSVPVYFYTGVYASKYKADYGGTFTLTSNPREAKISAADNFNDEQNPTVTYSNAAGNGVDALDIAIYDPNGQTAYAGYRAATKTGTSYTFNLTDAERTALRKAATSNTLDVRFYLRTKIGSYTGYSSIAKTMTITNGNPTLNPTVVDNNATTKALTGDANKLVKYYSNAYYTINAAAVKEATLSSQKVTHNGSSKTTATGTYNAVENASFTFEAKDSRGNTTTKTITKTLINYVKLTCNQKIRISAEGTATIDITGNYFNGSFGATANTLTVEYRYKTQGGSYSSWTAVTASKSGNSYTAQATKTGLNYQTTYVFQCRAIDKINTGGVNTEEKTVKSLPVFDWGENDFHIHGNLIVEGTVTGSNATGAVVLEDGEVVSVGSDFVIANGTTTVDGFTWHYRKWNGGTYECWGVSNISTAVNTAWGSLYVSGSIAATNKKFPITFASVPNVTASLSGSGSGAFLIASGSGTTSTTSTGIYEIARGSALASAGTFNINYQVVGKWK